MPTEIKGPTVSREVFGGVLDYDSAGFYAGLELVNLVCCANLQPCLANLDSPTFRLRAHDFARRLVWDEGFPAEGESDSVLYDQETVNAIRALLECLQLEIPSTTKRPTWERAHFFPYVPSLVHWDARLRGGRIRIERRYLRGGGALAYLVLASDPDCERLDRIRRGFGALFKGAELNPLERLAAVLARHGTSAEEPSTDQILASMRARDFDATDDLYREGTDRILGHLSLPNVARIRAIMSWTAFWLVTLQHRRAAEYLGRPGRPIVCDCGAGHPQLRRASQRCYKELESLILEASDYAANQLRTASALHVADRRVNSASPLPGLSKSARNKLRGFFWASAATINLLNAWKGRRHFTLGLGVLEPLLLAAVEHGGEMTYESFIDDWLYKKCHLVVGRSAAEQSGLLSSFDSSIFEDNENRLSKQMVAAGILTEYSDATRMVGTGGLLL